MRTSTNTLTCLSSTARRSRKAKDVVAKIYIRRSKLRWLNDDSRSTTDIAPLKRLSKRSPHFDLLHDEGLEGKWWGFDEMRSMTDMRKNSTWWKYFGMAVTAVLVQLIEKSNYIRVDIIVKREFREPWMKTASERKTCTGEFFTRRGLEEARWMLEVGLGFREMSVFMVVEDE